MLAGTIAVFGPRTGSATFSIPVAENFATEAATEVPLNVDVVPVDEIGESEIPSFAPGPMQGQGFKLPRRPKVTAIQVMTNK